MGGFGKLGKVLRELGSYQIKAVWIFLPLLVGLIYFVGPESGFLKFGILILAVLIMFWTALQFWGEDFRHSFESLAAILSCLALILAGYWFFVERRSIPKLNVEPQIQTWPIGEGRAFARIELLLENVGSTDITIDPSDDLLVEIGQVLPLTGGHSRMLEERYYFPLTNKRGALPIIKTDKYSKRAELTDKIDIRKEDRRDIDPANDEFDFKIEAGETERRYFKAIIPCEDGLVSSVFVEVPKKLQPTQKLFERDSRQHFWRGQGISEMIVDCNSNRGMKK